MEHGFSVCGMRVFLLLFVAMFVFGMYVCKESRLQSSQGPLNDGFSSCIHEAVALKVCRTCTFCGLNQFYKAFAGFF